SAPVSRENLALRRPQRATAGARPQAAREAASSAGKLGLLLGEEGGNARLEIFGVEAGVTLVALWLRQGFRIEQPVDEFLVPARDQRRAISDAPRRRVGFLDDLVVGDHAADEPFLISFACAP